MPKNTNRQKKWSVHVCHLYLYDSDQQRVLWNERYVVLDGQDDRIQIYCDRRIAGLVRQFDTEYVQPEFHTQWYREEQNRNVPQLLDGDLLLLGQPMNLELTLQGSVRTTLARQNEILHLWQLMTSASSPEDLDPEVMVKRSCLTQLQSDLWNTYSRRYPTQNPALPTKGNW